VPVLSQDLKTFIAACARGVPEARMAFQEQYSALIYTFPGRIFGLPEDEAGDFYLYVFEKERIYRRISSFEGRNAMQFETYLSYYVLRDLFLEWVRTHERVDMVSLDTSVEEATADGERAATVQDLLPAAEPTPATLVAEADAAQEVEGILRQLDVEKRVLLKLLALDTVELAPDDIRVIARLAARSIRETLDLLEEASAGLSAKAIKAQEKREALYAVSHWIHTYQRRLMALEEDVRAGRFQGDSPALSRLTHDKAELERKLVWRYRQQARLREELRKFEVRPSYKDIASLLNLAVGTVCSRIARAREEFGQRLAVARTAHTEGP
jgi:RNA polymerase sigma factor (sigma-70 family)